MDAVTDTVTEDTHTEIDIPDIPADYTEEGPEPCIGWLCNVRALAAGLWHTCALMEWGGVKCWGDASSGQLGIGAHPPLDEYNKPMNAQGLDSGVSAVAAGMFHTCALMDTGSIKCWGNNQYGQLGNGTTDTYWTPQDVEALGSGALAVSTGDFHTCALLDTGGIQCWGNNELWQLGVSTVEYSPYPIDVPGLESGVSDVAAGGLPHRRKLRRPTRACPFRRI